MTPARPRRRESEPPSALPEAALEFLAGRFRLLADVRRLRILRLLLEGERTVGEIVEACGSSQANVSMHLAQLRAEGLVAARRVGTQRLYRVADPLLADLCRTACRSIEGRMAGDLARMKGQRRPSNRP